MHNNNNTQEKRERRDRSEEILKTATKLFSQKGFRGTSLASIAQEVGLTEPGLLHYFPSKVLLLQAVLAYRDKKEEQQYRALLSNQNVDIIKILDSLKDLVAENQKNPAIIRLFTVLVAESIRPSHPSHTYFVERYQYGRKAYAEIFMQLQAEGQIRADADPLEIGALFMAMMDGLQIQWLLDPKHVDLTALFDLFTKIMESFLIEKSA